MLKVAFTFSQIFITLSLTKACICECIRYVNACKYLQCIKFGSMNSLSLNDCADQLSLRNDRS